MGRYLGIGIVTDVRVTKERAIEALSGEDAAKDFLCKRYNPTGLYDFVDDGEDYKFILNRDVIRREWIDVLKAFYPLRYPNWDDKTNVIGSLQALDDPEKWLAKEATYGHEGKYSKWFYYDVAYHDWGRSVLSHVDMICLSYAGKIVMEDYNDIMAFFTRLIREKLSAFQLRDAFKVDIVG